MSKNNKNKHINKVHKEIFGGKEVRSGQLHRCIQMAVQTEPKVVITSCFRIKTNFVVLKNNIKLTIKSKVIIVNGNNSTVIL